MEREAVIPKKIFTIWLNDQQGFPPLVQKCIETQKLQGYEHKLITLENCFKGCKYVNDAIAAKKWVKASDWLRMHELYINGGIHLDADMEVLPGKNFDHLLNCDMYIPMEECGHFGNAGLGSIPGHPILKKYLDRVADNFQGTGDLVYEPGIRAFTDVCWIADKTGVILIPPHVFFPYNHDSRKTEIKPDTLVFHHYAKTWVTEEFNPLPIVSIIIPTLGRAEGLEKCIESIKQSKYPQHRLQVIVVDGQETVPCKVANTLKDCTGNLIIYAANDMTFHPDAILNAVEASKKHGLVAFSSGELYPDNGNICEHFLIRRDIIPKINGQIFDTGFHHVGCDNFLWAQCTKLGEAYRCEDAKVTHNHFTKGSEMDEVYQKGWSNVERDRKYLADKLEGLKYC